MPHAPSRPIFTVAALREFEARHVAVEPPLMERAGAAAVAPALELIGTDGAPPLIICGPGNNGGDGFVLARLLRERGLAPVVVFAGSEERLPGDARRALSRYRDAGGTLAGATIPPGRYALAVDALFGIGLQRPLEGPHAELVARLNGLDCSRLALDIPSGLCADTGRVLGAALRAERTATFIALKPGLLTLDGPDHCGSIDVCGLGLDAGSEAAGRTATPQLFAGRLRPRPRNSHKGMMGSAAILGGAAGMAGAALLAGRAALKLGAGRVFVGLLDVDAPAVDFVQPELMLRRPQEILAAGLATALAAGPGLGQSGEAAALLRQAIAAPLPLLLDADALNLLAARPVLAAKLRRREAPTLLTPHPLEAARLLGSDAASVQADRLGAALALAGKFAAVVVLKGCGSVIAAPGGRWFINESGNPGMASAGMGDVLSGLALALLAQGWEAEAAALCAVHLHGLAADLLAGGGVGPAGLAAGETIDAARRLFNAWIAA
ncbi:MAG TPA: NAD(P)H-hydrate dehydratase [Candidatus Desulfobacillus sp.]|nr:NAD(P)H-hydrate dehydratase [Candidatus Desulfobacillus sp.]